MKHLHFVMQLDGKTVATGQASAVMTHAFQTAFWQGICSDPTDLLVAGRFVTLPELIGLKRGKAMMWEVKLVDQRFSFYVTGLAD